MATSRSLNKVMIIGNLTRSPSAKQLQNDAMITTFGVATNKTWKTQDGRILDKAEYHNVVAWNKLAEICANLLDVGMLVYVEGELTTQSWEVNGVKVERVEIRASDMKIMDAKGKKGVGVEAAIANANNKNNGSNEVANLSDMELPVSDAVESAHTEAENLF